MPASEEDRTDRYNNAIRDLDVRIQDRQRQVALHSVILADLQKKRAGILLMKDRTITAEALDDLVLQP